MKVEYGTDIGAVRASNQDTCECGLFSTNSAWALVCDGMGGARGGKEASTLAVETIRKLLTAGFQQDMNEVDLKNLMINAVSRANTAIYDMSMENSELRGMGTTAVLMVATGGKLHVVHVGDSRGYLKTKKGLEQITMDHSYVQDLVNLGQLTPAQARVHPQRNIITRVLGVYDEVRCDYSCFDFAEGDMALACSDGLTSYFEDSLLLEYMEKYGQDEQQLVKELIQHAIESGGYDNITVATITNG